MKVRNI